MAYVFLPTNAEPKKFLTKAGTTRWLLTQLSRKEVSRRMHHRKGKKRPLWGPTATIAAINQPSPIILSTSRGQGLGK
jgi:hypothetical protein